MSPKQASENLEEAGREKLNPEDDEGENCIADSPKNNLECCSWCRQRHPAAECGTWMEHDQKKSMYVNSQRHDARSTSMAIIGTFSRFVVQHTRRARRTTVVKDRTSRESGSNASVQGSSQSQPAREPDPCSTGPIPEIDIDLLVSIGSRFDLESRNPVDSVQKTKPAEEPAVPISVSAPIRYERQWDILVDL